MKMIRDILLSAAFLGLLGITAHARSGSGDATETSGERNVVKEWVFNEDQVAHDVGSVLSYKSGGTYPGVSVTTTATANDGLVAGVVVQASIPARTWGWIQVVGYHSAVKIQENVTAGDTVVSSTNTEKAGLFTIAQATGTVANQAKTSGRLGVVLETSTGSTAKVMLLGR